MLLRGIGDIEDDLEGDGLATPSFVTPQTSDVIPIVTTSPATPAASGGGSSSIWNSIASAFGSFLKPVASGVASTATGQAAAIAAAKAQADQMQTIVLVGGAAVVVLGIVLLRRNRRDR